MLVTDDQDGICLRQDEGDLSPGGGLAGGEEKASCNR
jgi:hypothetical protein